MSGRRRELVLQRQPLSNLLVALPLLLVLSVSCSATTETRGADDETIDLWDSFGGKGETRRNGTIEIDEPKAPFSQRGNENNDDTLSRRLKDRIIGGTPVAEGEYPFYAFPIGMLLCGATLIAPQILLTAAHCGEVWTSAGALLGGTQITGQESTPHGVDLEFPHPDYDTTTDANDIMLVKLSEPISDVTPVQLNFDQNVPSDGEAVKVIGFGNTEPDGTFSDVLLEAGIEAFPFFDCNMYYGSILDDVMVCAGTTEGGRDSCQGDSGGPLMTQNNVQIGVVSFGDSCGQPGVPAVYARVSGYQEWITQGVCDLSDTPPSECSVTDPPVDVPVDLPTLGPTASIVTGQPTATPVQEATSAPIMESKTPVQVASPISIPSSSPLTLAPIPVPTSFPITASTIAPVPVSATTTAPTDPQPTADTISPLATPIMATAAPAIPPVSAGSPTPVQSSQTVVPQSIPVSLIPQTTPTPVFTRSPSKSKSKRKKKKTNKSKKSLKSKSSSKIKTSSSSKKGKGKSGMSSSKSRKGGGSKKKMSSSSKSKARKQSSPPTFFSRRDVPTVPRNKPKSDYLFGEW